MRPAQIPLPLALAVLASTLAAPVAGQESPLSLRIERVTPSPHSAEVTITVSNRTDHPVAFCPPLGGSTYDDRVQPRYRISFERRGHPPSQPGLCGNHGGSYRQAHLRVLAGGAATTVTASVPARLSPGTWTAQLTYSIARHPEETIEPGATLWLGSVEAPSFTFTVAGPTWDEWLELPAMQVLRFLERDLSSDDASIAGAAVDGFVEWAKSNAIAEHGAALRPHVVKTVATLSRAILADESQRFDASRTLSAQLAALFGLPPELVDDTSREILRRTLRDSKHGAARANLMSVLAQHPRESDLPTLEAEFLRPDAHMESFRNCLTAYSDLRGTDAAIERAMATLEKIKAGPRFTALAMDLGTAIGVFEPSYIRVGEHGRTLATEPDQHRLVRRQWIEWWKARR